MGRIAPEYLAQLFDAHAAALVLYARQWCHAAEDVVQDAFLTLARQSLLPGRIVPWLYRVVRNGALAANRRERRRRTRETRASAPELWFSAADDRIDALSAQAILGQIEPNDREAIVARICGGLTFEDIARLQGCSVTTAHRRYQAGLAQLQQRLEPSWTHHPTASPRTT
jgi:RNA polymerase sigma-70 factor (ECF subfamily)